MHKRKILKIGKAIPGKCKEKAEITVLISEKNLGHKGIERNKEGRFIMLKLTIHNEDINY